MKQNIRLLHVLVAGALLYPNCLFSATLPNIYKSCALENHPPIYNLRRDEICGVESVTNYASEKYGVKAYKPCRSTNNPMESWSILPPRGRGPSTRISLKDRSLFGTAFGSQGDAKDREICDTIAKKLQSELNMKVDLRLHYWKLEKYEMNLSSNGPCYAKLDPGVFPLVPIITSYTCPQIDPTFFFAMGVPTYKDLPNADCGVESYNSRDHFTYRECRHINFGIERYESQIDEDCGVDPILVSKLSDDEYASILTQALKNLTEKNDTAVRWQNLRELLRETNFTSRNVPFGLVSKTKLLATSLDVASAVGDAQRMIKTYTGFIINDAYARLNAAYVAQRSRELLRLQDLITRLAQNNANVEKALSELRDKLKDANLNPLLKKSLLERLQGQGASRNENLTSIAKELSRLLQNDIAICIKDAERFLQDQTPIRPIFAFNAIPHHIDLGNYNQALLKIQEAQVFFRKEQLTHLPVKGDWFMDYLKENAKTKTAQDLLSANHIFEKINSNDTITPADLEGMGVSLSPRLVDLLAKVNLRLGESLGPVRFQLLDLIDKTILSPLTDFQESLGD